MSQLYEILSICKGGGYMYARTNPLHPKANSKGLYPLHRILVENSLGRNLEDNEDVHHIDENKNNNDISNLIVLPHGEHQKLHAIKRAVDNYSIVCEACKNMFFVSPSQYRLRAKRNKSNKVFCSRSCGRLGTSRSRYWHEMSKPKP